MTENKEKIILDLCGGTGSWSKPYKEAGYTVFNITWPDYDVLNQHPGATNLLFFNKDGKDLMISTKKVYGILAAPPCTMFSLARQTVKTPRDFEGAMLAVRACLETIWMCRAKGNLKFWALENPTGYLRQFLGRPAYHFEGWWFGDSIKKPTDLWGYFNEPKKLRGAMRPEYPRKGKGAWANHSAGGSWQRSVTPPKFAKAFFEANQ